MSKDESPPERKAPERPSPFNEMERTLAEYADALREIIAKLQKRLH